MKEDGKKHTLQIDSVTAEDAGQYDFVAQNTGGKTQASVHVTVTPKSGEAKDDISLNGKAGEEVVLINGEIDSHNDEKLAGDKDEAKDEDEGGEDGPEQDMMKQLEALYQKAVNEGTEEEQEEEESEEEDMVLPAITRLVEHAPSEEDDKVPGDKVVPSAALLVSAEKVAEEVVQRAVDDAGKDYLKAKAEADKAKENDNLKGKNEEDKEGKISIEDTSDDFQFKIEKDEQVELKMDASVDEIQMEVLMDDKGKMEVQDEVGSEETLKVEPVKDNDESEKKNKSDEEKQKKKEGKEKRKKEKQEEKQKKAKEKEESKKTKNETEKAKSVDDNKDLARKGTLQEGEMKESEVAPSEMEMKPEGTVAAEEVKAPVLKLLASKVDAIEGRPIKLQCFVKG